MPDPEARAVIAVEVAYAEADRQFLRRLELVAGARVADAIAASRLQDELDVDVSVLDVGIWSRPSSRDTLLRDGDRVELYRPLKVDPKDARRRRAERRRRGPA